MSKALQIMADAVRNGAAMLAEIKARTSKRMVGYFFPVVPEELIYAAKIHPVQIYPLFQEMITEGDAHLQSFLCSYCRNHLGYVRSADPNPPMGGIGSPDLLLLSSSACTHYFKWWDTLRETTGKPLIFVNTPRVMDTDAMPDYYLPFVQEEIRLAIAEIEKRLGITIHPAKLAQAVHRSDQVVLYWQKILALQKAVPAPMGLSDLGNALFILIVLAGTQEGEDLMKRIYEETARRVDTETGILKKEEEKHRLLWLNIPFWHKVWMPT